MLGDERGRWIYTVLPKPGVDPRIRDVRPLQPIQIGQHLLCFVAEGLASRDAHGEEQGELDQGLRREVVGVSRGQQVVDHSLRIAFKATQDRLCQQRRRGRRVDLRMLNPVIIGLSRCRLWRGGSCAPRRLRLTRTLPPSAHRRRYEAGTRWCFLGASFVSLFRAWS